VNFATWHSIEIHSPLNTPNENWLFPVRLTASVLTNQLALFACVVIDADRAVIDPERYVLSLTGDQTLALELFY
jgi:hypothetical protein